MSFELAVSCEACREMEPREQHSVEQRVFHARVVHAGQCRLRTLNGLEVACEVDPAARASQIAVNTFVVTMNPAIEQFACFGS